MNNNAVISKSFQVINNNAIYLSESILEAGTFNGDLIGCFCIGISYCT